MKKKNIVGFIGVVGSGKDYAAKFWASEFPNLKCVKVSFASALLEMAWNILGYEVPEDDYEEWKKRVMYVKRDGTFFTGRDFLINLGLEMRKHDPEFWIKKAIKKIDEEIANGADVILMTDTRFINEAEMIIEAGGKLQFCNYDSDRYNPNIESSSEALAQLLLEMGHSHGEDVTGIVSNLIEEDFKF